MDEINVKTVATSIGWLDNMADEDDIEFFSVDWSNVEETGKVYLDGRRGNHDVHAVVQFVEVTVAYIPPWDPEDDDDEGLE